MSKSITPNTLLACAMPLLLLMAKLKQTEALDSQSILPLRQQIVEEMHGFTERANTLHCPNRLVLAARYCLCTATDEFVLSTSWGINSVWPFQTLLSIVHQETSGGERFFIILEEISKSPTENLSLLEVMYVILSLGFEGKYYQEEQAVRDQIRHRLFNLIAMHSQETGKLLSPTADILKKSRTLTYHSWSRLKIIGIGVITLLSIGTVFNYLNFLSAQKPIAELWAINQEAAKIPLPALVMPALNPPPVTQKAIASHPTSHHHPLKHKHQHTMRRS